MKIPFLSNAIARRKARHARLSDEEFAALSRDEQLAVVRSEVEELLNDPTFPEDVKRIIRGETRDP